jgi:hypothetical protein
MIERGRAPSVRRMAMSACLSVTAMTSVDTRLKAATATISDRMMNIMFFSICTARKKLAWLLVQSQIGVGIDVAHQFAGDARRLEQVIDLQAHAVTPSPIW